MKKCWIIPQGDFPIDWVKRQVGPDDTILALTLSALAECRRNFQRVLSVEDLVPYEEIMTLAIRAHEINLEFARQSSRETTLDGYDWPLICWHMQQWFFRDVLLADRLAESLKAKEFDRIVWLGKPTPQKNRYVLTMDSVAEVMRVHWGENFEWLPLPIIFSNVKQHPFLKKIKNYYEHVLKKISFWERLPPPCEVVAVWSIREWERYTEAMEDLKRGFKDQFQVWVLSGKYPPRFKKWVKSAGIHPVRIAYPDVVDNDIRTFFDRRWEHWISKGRWDFAQAVSYPALAADELQGHFRYYFLKVWPHLAQWARKTEIYLLKTNPRWLIGSSNYPPEWIFPLYAGTKLGIPSIALPHSFVQYGDGTVQADFLACRNRFERMSFQRPFPDDRRVLFCHNAGNNLSYLCQPLDLQNGDHKKVIAVLTADPDYEGSLMPTADRRAFLEDFGKIYSLPPDLHGLNILIKSHPRGDVTPLLKNLFPNPPAHVVFANPLAPVNDLLVNAWVIVLANHYGGVVVQAVMSGKPLIFLDSAKSFWPYTEKIAFAAGEVVEDMEGFWNLLRKLKDSPALYQELSDRCQTFKTTYLQPATQTLSQRIRELEVQQEFISGKDGVQPILSV